MNHRQQSENQYNKSGIMDHIYILPVKSHDKMETGQCTKQGTKEEWGMTFKYEVEARKHLPETENDIFVTKADRYFVFSKRNIIPKSHCAKSTAERGWM